MSGYILPKTSGLLEVPFSKNARVYLITTGLTFAAAWLNSFNFGTVVSMTPEFLADQARIGPVAHRTDAPPVFLNPIRNGIPGNILGPEDLDN